MKTILNNIDKLYEAISNGLLTRSEANLKIRELRSSIADKYEEGSDNFTTCINSLVDCHLLINEL